MFLLLASALTSGKLSAGTVHYYYTDPQGNVLAEADAQGNITARYDYRPYGSPAMAQQPDGPGYIGHVNDLDTGLVYMQARYYDPEAGRFLSVDPKQRRTADAFGFSRYAYANNSPTNNVDPNGKDCTTSNRVTTCFTAAYRVSFPAQPGFKDFTTASTNYHFYSVPVDTPGMSKEQIQNYLSRNPTPGFSNGASPQGTRNDATPVIGNYLTNNLSPVMSFSLTNQVDGQPVVVNVTQANHPLASGVVVREATQAKDGTTSIQSWGEGASSLQAPGTITGEILDNVWKSQGPPSPPSPTGCAQGGGMNNVCSK